MLIEEHVSVCKEPQVELFTARSTASAERALLIIHGGPDWDHTYLREPLVELAGPTGSSSRTCAAAADRPSALPDDEYNADAVVSDLVALLDTLTCRG